MAKSVWQTKAEQAQRELEVFKQRVVDTAWDWSGGCPEGKTEFIEELGLKIPEQPWVFQFEVRMNVIEDAKEISDDVKYSIKNCLERDYGTDFTSVDVTDYWEES